MFDKERFASGDREYVDQVVRESSPMVMMVCQSYARDRDHAEDLFQETWKSVWINAASFHGRGSFRSWLHRVATNVCLSDLRAQRTRSASLKRLEREPAVESTPHVDPLHEAYRREFQLGILRALPRLPEGQREAFTLRVLEGRRPAEVAKIMGIEPSTVRSHVRHALNRMRAMLEDPDDELSRYGTNS